MAQIAKAGFIKSDMVKGDRVSIVLRGFFRDKINVGASSILAIISICCFGANFISYFLGQERDAIDTNLLNQGYQPPTAPGVGGHILGTDELARDLFIRLLYGGQVSLSVGFLTAIISTILGAGGGVLAGYFRGWVDGVVSLLIEIIANLPVVFLLIVLSSFVRFQIWNISLFIGCLSWISVAKVVRVQVIGLRNQTYLEAARVIGASNPRILFVHVLPNILPIFLVAASLQVSTAIILEAGLSFLGFGVAIPIPSWGNIISSSPERYNGLALFFQAAPWLVWSPIVFLIITCLCVVLIANGLRDAFDLSR